MSKKPVVAVTVYYTVQGVEHRALVFADSTVATEVREGEAWALLGENDVTGVLAQVLLRLNVTDAELGEIQP